MRLFYELLFPSYFRMNVAAAVVGGASLVGSAMNANAAGKAAKAQSKAADQANATQLQMYNQTREDNAPFLKNGVAGSNKLANLLGLGGPTLSMPTRDQYASPAADPITQAYRDILGRDPDAGGFATWSNALKDNTIDQIRAKIAASPEAQMRGPNATPYADSQYQSALDAYNAQQAQFNDPSYGSLLKKFDQNDLNNDVVYQNGLQFGLDQGVNALNRQAAASGSYMSGAAAKALTRFGNDYGTTKANDAYNRYTNDNTNRYNKLAGISGAGQTASSQVGASGANAANQIANNQTAVGNARGASAIAQGNAWSGGLNSIANGYQTNQLLGSNGYTSVPYIGGATNQTANFNEYGTGYSP